MIGVGTTALGYCSAGGRLDSTLNTPWESGNLQTKTRLGSVNGRLLRGNISGKGGFWLNEPNKILAEGRPGNQTLLEDGGGRRNLNRYQG